MRLSAFHPLTALVYFATVLAVTMFCFSPAVGICSAVGAFLFCAITQSCRQTASDLAFYIFLTAVLTVTNPLFSHKGVNAAAFRKRQGLHKGSPFLWLDRRLIPHRCDNVVQSSWKGAYGNDSGRGNPDNSGFRTERKRRSRIPNRNEMEIRIRKQRKCAEICLL